MSPVFGELVTTDNGLTYTTSLKYSGVCPVFTYNPLIKFISRYEWFFGGVFIILGIILAFFGRTLFPYAMFIFGSFITSGGILLLCYVTYLQRDQKAYVIWFTFIMAVVCGLVMGYLCAKFERLGAAAITGWGGYICSLFLNAAIHNQDSVILSWSITIGFVLLCGISTLCYLNESIILSTSMVGSYFFIRGISFYANGFPNEYILIHKMRVENHGKIVENAFYGYLCGILIMTVICTGI